MLGHQKAMERIDSDDECGSVGKNKITQHKNRRRWLEWAKERKGRANDSGTRSKKAMKLHLWATAKPSDCLLMMGNMHIYSAKTMNTQIRRSSIPNGTHNWIVHFCDGQTRVYFIYSLNCLNRFATIIRLLLLFSWFDFVEMAMNYAETVNTLNSLRNLNIQRCSVFILFFLFANNNML